MGRTKANFSVKIFGERQQKGNMFHVELVWGNFQCGYILWKFRTVLCGHKPLERQNDDKPFRNSGHEQNHSGLAHRVRSHKVIRRDRIDDSSHMGQHASGELRMGCHSAEKRRIRGRICFSGIFLTPASASKKLLKASLRRAMI